MNLIIVAKLLPEFPLVIEANCSHCHQVKSRRGAIECDLDGRLKFLCKECVKKLDETDRQVDLVGGAA